MDTLVHDPFREAVPQVFGQSLEAYFAVKSKDAYLAFEEGRIDVATYARTMFTDGRIADLDALQDAFIAGYRWLDGIPALLGDLRAYGVEMHALSNYSVFYQHIEAKLGVSAWVPWTFVSCRTGARKPEPATYHAAARHLAVPPEACVFVDDREKNCEGARAAGMSAIRFQDAHQLRRDLLAAGLPLPA